MELIHQLERARCSTPFDHLGPRPTTLGFHLRVWLSGALPKSSSLLGNLLFTSDSYRHLVTVENVRWYRADGADQEKGDWQGPGNQAVARLRIGLIDCAIYL